MLHIQELNLHQCFSEPQLNPSRLWRGCLQRLHLRASMHSLLSHWLVSVVFRVFSMPHMGGGTFYTWHRLDYSQQQMSSCFPSLFHSVFSILEFTSTQFCGFMKIFAVYLRVMWNVWILTFEQQAGRDWLVWNVRNWSNLCRLTVKVLQ